MLSKRIPLRGGVEYDIFTAWRRVYTYTKRPGVCKYVKRAYNKRLRAVHKRETEALT